MFAVQDYRSIIAKPKVAHGFALHAFHYGMDVKTLASTIGHESVETTLNVYAHTSEKMKQDATDRIDSTLGTAAG